jgi:hypothetical protein|tara:strand:+ start:133 stop:279 length:147 start_codon:yes stop_codon:yes gene_type:complete
MKLLPSYNNNDNATFSRFARHSASFFRSGDPRPGNRNILTPFATSLHA